MDFHICDDCNRYFSNRGNLNRHIRLSGCSPSIESIYNRGLHFCTECGKSFSSFGNLTKHKDVHTGKIFPCKSCSKIFRTTGGLLKHQKIHGDAAKRYKCTVCEKRFSYMYLVNEHEKTHTRELECNRSDYTLICDECGEEFTSESILSKHRTAFHSEVKRKADGTIFPPTKRRRL